MPHIHELIDFTVSCYVVYAGKVLLVDHTKYGLWLPVGGHIELDEDPEQALLREVKEESGLEVEILGEKPEFPAKEVKSLLTPQYMNIHYAVSKHRHMDMVYFARAKTNEAKLAEKEHKEIRWFSRQDLSDPKYNLRTFVRFYAGQALEKIQA